MAESRDNKITRNGDDLEGRHAVLASSKDGVEDGGVPECAVCLQSCIHPCRLPCGHVFCFLCIKGTVATAHPGSVRRCAMCRREIPPDFLDKPVLLCPVFPAAPRDEASSTNPCAATEQEPEAYLWFYEGRNGWWQYDERTGAQLEGAHERGEACCEVLICGSLYTIDLVNKVQRRKGTMGRVRRIKRDVASAEKKGIAGLSWWQYDERTRMELECAYKRGERSCELLIAGFLYVADFDGMVQLRRGDPSRRRRIKRDLASIPVKGVAGLRPSPPQPPPQPVVVTTGGECSSLAPGGESPPLSRLVDDMARLNLSGCMVSGGSGVQPQQEREEEEEGSGVLWSPVSPDSAWVLTLSSDEDQL
ncbi:E3 ubiquitin-protein ligase RNF146 [Ischnura elegans]|uniref:E3 ubiquitin-protein ligase RNF146 n=1 Tax=Ischnura elegans TaxID=197161 RepID=UPI001ED89BA7|nr:E3 ubiquitin-protein ligase RNF146 [Ischnura elegans]